MTQRQYAPQLGRFLEVDPINGGAANDYDYATGDPVNKLDLDGTYTRCWLWGLYCNGYHLYIVYQCYTTGSRWYPWPYFWKWYWGPIGRCSYYYRYRCY